MRINLHAPRPCGVDVQTAHMLAGGVLAVYMAWRLASLAAGREHVGVTASEIIREFVVWAAVFSLVVGWQLAPTGEQMRQAADQLNQLIDEAYVRIEKYARCMANIRLSGPFAAYAGLAEAKFLPYQTVYTAAINVLSQLHGAALFLADYLPILLAVGFLLYAAWLRPLGGAVLGLTLAAALAVAYTAWWAPQQVQQMAGQLPRDFHPFIAVGCDDRLAEKFDQDLEGWRRLVYGALFALLAAPVLGGAAGAVLGRL